MLTHQHCDNTYIRVIEDATVAAIFIARFLIDDAVCARRSAAVDLASGKNGKFGQVAAQTVREAEPFIVVELLGIAAFEHIIMSLRTSGSN